MEVDDLYGDLGEQARAIEAEKYAAAEKRYAAQDQELQELRDQIKCLVEEKKQLEENIVSLYHTAQREIGRKDQQIAALTQEVSGLRRSTAASSTDTRG